jgi:uncharacterized protein
MLIIGYVLFVFMGLALGLIGGGGSILTVPILHYFFKQETLIATTNSLFIVGVIALLGAFLSFRNGQLNFKMGVLFAAPSFVGIFVSRSLILPALPEELIYFQGYILTKSILVMLVFSMMMIMASLAMIRTGKKTQIIQSSSEPKKIPITSVIYRGFLTGCFTWFVGAGGGFIIIPALVLLLKLHMREAIGTSLAIIAVNSIFGFAISSSSNTTEWLMLFSICLLGGFGLFLGRSISKRINEKNLKRGFGFFVLLVGSLILIDQVRALV